MSEKPQKRLVSKGQYVQVLGKKIGLQSLATVVATVFVTSGLFTASCLLVTCLSIPSLLRHPERFFAKLFITMFLGICTWAMYWLSNTMFANAKSIEPVAPITERNAHLLPAQDTLVRGSDLPPSEQQSELLRATQNGQETPPEELLRMVVGDK